MQTTVEHQPAAKLLAEWFWTDRWIGSSAFLLPIEPRGLYREMLTQAWRRGARLPNDHEAIRRAIGCTRQEWSRCWPKVQRFWRVDGDGLVNDTQLEIWTQAISAKRRASDRGKRGSQARWEHSTSNAQADAQASPKHSTSTKQAQRKHKPPSPSPSSSEHRAVLNGAASILAAGEDAVDGDLAADVPKADIGAFLKRFCELYAKYRHGAKYFVKREQHVTLVRRLLRIYDLRRLEKLSVVLLTTDDAWVKETDRGIGILAVKASWLDSLLAEYEAAHGEIAVAS